MARKSNKETIGELEKEVAQLKRDNKKLEKQLKNSKKNTWKVSPRQIVAYFLLTVAGVMSISAVNMLFIRDSLLSTETWVEQTTEIIQNEQVRSNVASRVTEVILEKTNIEQNVANVLPEQANGLSAPIAGYVADFTEEKLNELLASEEFINLWRGLNEEAHSTLVSLVEKGEVLSDAEKAESVFYIDNDFLLLNLRPIINDVKADLTEAGVPFLPKNNLVPDEELQVQLVSVGNSEMLFEAYDVINTAGVLLPIGFLILSIAGVALAIKRRRATYYLAFLILALAVIELLLLRAPVYELTSQLSSEAVFNPEAIRFIYISIINSVVLSLRILAFVSILIILFLYLTGSSKLAVYIRNSITNFSKNYKSNKVVKFVGANSKTIISLVVGLTILILLAIEPNSVWVPLSIVFISGITVLGVQSISGLYKSK